MVQYWMLVRPSICTPVIGRSFDEFSHHLALTQKLSDFVELRLDSISELTRTELTQLRNLTYKKAICTCRIADQGGMRGVGEEQRITLIRHALTLGFTYVDIEYETMKLHRIVIPQNTQLVLSAHVFTHTPSDKELGELIQQMNYFEPAVLKIATMTQTPSDLVRIFALLDRRASLVVSPTQLLLIGMGEQGKESRIQGPKHGCPWTYASTPWGASAPGQLDYQTLSTYYTQLESSPLQSPSS
jgi:3-dehydroquinate dehydratase type I